MRKCFRDTYQAGTMIELYLDMEEYSDYLADYNDLYNLEEYEQEDEFNEIVEKETYDEEVVDCFIYMGEMDYF